MSKRPGRKKVKDNVSKQLLDLFNIEYGFEFGKKREMSDIEWVLFNNFILGLFAVEWGVYLRGPNEDENAEQQTLTELLYERN